MSSSEEVTVRSTDDLLAEVMSSLTEISERLAQYVYQRLTTKQHESLKVSMAEVQTKLTTVQTRMRVAAQDQEIQSSKLHADTLGHDINDETRFSTLTSGIESSCDGLEFEKGEQMNGRIDEILKLRRDNSRLVEETNELQLELRIIKDENKKLLDSSFNVQSVCGGSTVSLDFLQTTQELSRSKETLLAMKADRKKLKAENFDLHMQMKQLYCTLGDKEAELRDFIRTYDQHKSDRQDSFKQLYEEKIRTDMESKELTKRAREAREQNMILKSQLQLKEEAVIQLRQQLLRTPRPSFPVSSSPVKNEGSRGGGGVGGGVKSCISESSIVKLSSSVGVLGAMSDNEVLYNDVLSCDGGYELPPYQEMYLANSSVKRIARTASISEGQYEASRERARMAYFSRYKQNSSVRFSRGMSPVSRGILTSLNQRSSVGLSQPITEGESPPPLPTSERGPSRVTFLTQDGHHEKLTTLKEAQDIPVSQWRANHVLAWLELDMNMVAHGQACSENIKSGKVLLGLSDSELDSALHLTSSLHRRKMRLAIEELRDPSSAKFPPAAAMDHMWVSHEWIYGLGLSQYSAAFEAHLVDGRLLGVLTKKDLDKHLGVHRKCHQTSVMNAIDLLRLVDFDKQVLHERRSRSNQNKDDPLVWSNKQIIQWAEEIDLQEYGKNLRGSGIHGAVLILDTSFTSDTFATVLGIPTSKSYVRRHLAAEFDAIVKPARAAVETGGGASRRSGTPFVRSFSSAANRSEAESGPQRGLSVNRKLSFRSSIGRAFGRRSGNDSSNDQTKSFSNIDLSLS